MEQKPKVFALNNFIASETGRLSSLSSLSKRDLSLGGNKPKKVYKPNLNVVRNKDKGKIAINNKVQQHQNNKRRALITRTNHQRYIQSGSVFSEGAGELLKRPKIHSDRYLSNGERDQTAIVMPKVIKWEVNAQEEKTVINELLADDEDDNSSENEGEYCPIVLPLKDNKDGFVKSFRAKKEDPDLVEIKEETPNFTFNNHRINGNIYNYDIPCSFQNKMYNEERPCISLLRMPDSLPGKGFIDDTSKVTDFDLSQMMEGKIGKILIRRSGRVEVQIGSMKYVLDSLEANPFKEDVMSISHDPKSSSFGPDMINLGNIDEKYILSPSWKNLFDLKVVRKKK